MAMKRWDKLNLEQKLRRIETAWRMQAEGRPPTEYAPYMSPAMLKSQFNNSIEEPPRGALPQSLFDASEAVRRGYTPPTGPDPPGPWSELPPQMQEGNGGGSPTLNTDPMVAPAQPPPMPAGNLGIGGGTPTPRPMVNSPVSGMELPPTAPYQGGPVPTGDFSQDYGSPHAAGRYDNGGGRIPVYSAAGMITGWRDPPSGYRVGLDRPGQEFGTPINAINAPVEPTLPGVQRATNPMVNPDVSLGQAAPIMNPPSLTPDIGVPQGAPNIPSMMGVPQTQQSGSGSIGGLGLGRIPQDIAPPMNIAATPNDGQGLWDRITESVGGLSDRIGGAINNRVGTFLDSRNNGMPQMSPVNNGRHKGSETEIKSLMERLELNKSHSRLGGISASRKLQLSRDQKNLQNRLAMIQSTFPGAQIPQLVGYHRFAGDEVLSGPYDDLHSPVDQVAGARRQYNMPVLDPQIKEKAWRRRIDPLIERENTPIPELIRQN